jgi:hypothetical protein
MLHVKHFYDDAFVVVGCCFSVFCFIHGFNSLVAHFGVYDNNKRTDDETIDDLVSQRS